MSEFQIDENSSFEHVIRKCLNYWPMLESARINGSSEETQLKINELINNVHECLQRNSVDSWNDVPGMIKTVMDVEFGAALSCYSYEKLGETILQLYQDWHHSSHGRQEVLDNMNHWSTPIPIKCTDQIIDLTGEDDDFDNDNSSVNINQQSTQQYQNQLRKKFGNRNQPWHQLRYQFGNRNQPWHQLRNHNRPKNWHAGINSSVSLRVKLQKQNRLHRLKRRKQYRLKKKGLLPSLTPSISGQQQLTPSPCKEVNGSARDQSQVASPQIETGFMVAPLEI